MNNELKQLKRHRTCTRVAIVWSCGWLMASCLMLADLARAQSIYLDHRYGTVDAAMVDEASWIFRERFGMGMGIVGTTTAVCQSPISVRLAGVAEWAAVGTTRDAVTTNCSLPLRYQIVWSPWVAITVRVMRHEMGHAAGCWQELPADALNVMHPNATATFLNVADMDCITASNRGPMGVVDKCFVEVASNLDMYIPSIAGLQVWLTYQGAMQWTLAASRATSLSCPGNALSGPVATFDDVRGYGLVPLSFVRLRNTGTTWTLEAAR